MKVKTRKTLVLTKEEQELIAELHNLFDDDRNLSIEGVWEILTDIAKGYNSMSADYGYDIEIVD
jgi:hypothetical protein